jgi:hypothetical protein
VINFEYIKRDTQSSIFESFSYSIFRIVSNSSFKYFDLSFIVDLLGLFSSGISSHKEFNLFLISYGYLLFLLLYSDRICSIISFMRNIFVDKE